MSITSRINEMSSHIEQAYDELQGLGADLTNVNKNIENISMVLDDIYDSMPQVSGEGTSLTLDDTRVGKIKSTLKGNTSQTGTPTPTTPIPVNVVSGDNEIVVNGKNLFDKSTAVLNKLVTGTGSLIDFTGVFSSDYIKVQPNTDYYVNEYIPVVLAFDKDKNVLGYIRNASGSATFTTSNNCGYIRVRMFDASVDMTTALNNAMLSLGTTSSTYEPYQGNTYNIDLPVENLFDKSNANTLNCLVNGTNGSIANFNNAKSLYIPIQSSETYTISKILSARFVVGTCVSTPANGVTCNVYSANNTGTSITITSGASDKFLCVFYYLSGTDTLTEQQILDSIQIEVGSKVNSYTPYGTTPIELCKIGNYQDYFYKDSGKWYLHKEIGKAVLNGTQNIGREPIQNNHYKFYIQNISNVDYGDTNYIPKILCDKLIAIGRTTMYVNTQGISSSNGALQIYTDDTKDMTISEFGTWLGSNNLIVYYGLITPTTTEITYQPLIDQLNLLEKAMSKDGQTNISQVNNDLPFIISASALKEWQESASLNSTLSMVSPLSLGNTLNTQENNTQPIEVDNIEPLEEEENEES